MSLRKLIIAASLVLIASLAAPSRAAADWLFTPFAGINWGGTVNFLEGEDFEDRFRQRATFGASLGWMGAGALGFELDFGFSPNFFDATVDTDFGFDDSSVTTLMANLIIGAPIGGQRGAGIRPYVVGGAGLIRSRINDPADFFNVDANSWGVNAGGGIIAFFSDNVGLRGDVRYFRSLQDVRPADPFDVAFGDFRFWRGTVGLTLRF